ncbi:m-phase inducer phosphatase [Saitoella coloradoensis]
MFHQSMDISPIPTPNSQLSPLFEVHEDVDSNTNHFAIPDRPKTRPNGFQRSRSHVLDEKKRYAGYFDLKKNAENGGASGTSSKCVSPTSCLVADMSENFHIDPKSPSLPTPRRSLLPSFSFNKPGPRTPDEPGLSIDHKAMLSSPMDISPLPHKLPAAADNARDRKSSDAFLKPSNQTRKARPPLTRMKGASFAALSNRSYTLASMNAANKENAMSMTMPMVHKPMSPVGKVKASSTSISLDQLFGSDEDATPIKKIGGLTAGPSILGGDSLTDSPTPAASDSPLAQVRRPGLPRAAQLGPRAPKFRRTQSLFQHPAEVLKPEIEDAIDAAAAATAAIASAKQAQQLLASPGISTTGAGESLILPCFGVQSDPLKRIDSNIMRDVLEGKYRERYDELVIVDCRFPYEYSGGHVQGAMNINDMTQLEPTFLNNPMRGKILMIFHCEYSQHRAPKMAMHLRNRDRFHNMKRYPQLWYPELYILDGGYRGFFGAHKDKCQGAYVEMEDVKHKSAYETSMHGFRKVAKSRERGGDGKKAIGMSRTASYTFGENEAVRRANGYDLDALVSSDSEMKESGKPKARGVKLFEDLKRIENRRTASY